MQCNPFNYKINFKSAFFIKIHKKYWKMLFVLFASWIKGFWIQRVKWLVYYMYVFSQVFSYSTLLYPWVLTSDIKRIVSPLLEKEVLDAIHGSLRQNTSSFSIYITKTYPLQFLWVQDRLAVFYQHFWDTILNLFFFWFFKKMVAYW